MRIALIEVKSKGELFPIQFLKIGAMLRKKKHKVTLFKNKPPKEPKRYDEIWLSVIFTYDYELTHKIVSAIRAMTKGKKVKLKLGGTAPSIFPEQFKHLGIPIHTGLIPEAEKCTPDYSLLEEDYDYSIGWTSRGCVRKCKFCAVPVVEPKFYHVDWFKNINKTKKKILFYDNNWLAKSKKVLKKDVEQMVQLQEEFGITEIDFNQALDARLMTEEIADIIAPVKLSPVRFAFDGMWEDGLWQNAIKMMIDRGFRTYNSLVLYNFKDTPEDLYYRIREHARMTKLMGGSDLVKAFPMRYQPLKMIKRDFLGENWTRKERSAFLRIVSIHGSSGTVSCRNLNEFEYWFGKNDKEFKALLNYPRLNELLLKRKGYLMANRAKVIEAKR